MIELRYEYLSVRCIWLNVLIMSRTHFRMNPHSIFAWMSRNFLLEPGIPFVKWWRSMMSLTGSRDWYIIYRRENKSRTVVISEVAMQQVLYLWKIIHTKSYYLVYCQYWSRDKCVFYKMVYKLLQMAISLGISCSRHGMKLKLSQKKLFTKGEH